jgi:hypothetical protein
MTSSPPTATSLQFHLIHGMQGFCRSVHCCYSSAQTSRFARLRGLPCAPSRGVRRLRAVCAQLCDCFQVKDNGGSTALHMAALEVRPTARFGGGPLSRSAL